MPKLVVGNWCVVNSRWVKIVNNLRKSWRIQCAYSSTNNVHKRYTNVVQCLNYRLIDPHLPRSSTAESTSKNAKTHLMNKSFTHFPQDLLINLKNEI